MTTIFTIGWKKIYVISKVLWSNSMMYVNCILERKSITKKWENIKNNWTGTWQKTNQNSTILVLYGKTHITIIQNTKDGCTWRFQTNNWVSKLPLLPLLLPVTTSDTFSRCCLFYGFIFMFMFITSFTSLKIKKKKIIKKRYIRKISRKKF